MIQKAVLDTDILSEFLKGIDPNVVKNGIRYAQAHGKLTFTSVTVFEIVRGLEQKKATAQSGKVLAWMKQNEEVVPSAADYVSAARIIASARHKGRVLELPDCLIAATAGRLGLPLVTGNTADYKAIQDTGFNLKLANWRDP